MIFLIISIVVPLLIYFLFPPFLAYLTGKQVRPSGLLLVACFLYFISWYLPSPLIEGRNTSIMTHVVGGGLFCGFLWLDIKTTLGLKFNIWFEVITLFALVSAFGVANELFELLIVQLKLVDLHLTDTSWDLVANTLGAVIFWVGYRLTRMGKK
ncbi:MAG TPA: hypothetical protein VGE59_01955 [Patescibacteria group bacterium]